MQGNKPKLHENFIISGYGVEKFSLTENSYLKLWDLQTFRKKSNELTHNHDSESYVTWQWSSTSFSVWNNWLSPLKMSEMTKRFGSFFVCFSMCMQRRLCIGCYAPELSFPVYCISLAHAFSSIHFVVIDTFCCFESGTVNLIQ